MSSTPPTEQQVGAALADLAILANWLHIDHNDATSMQRIVVSYRGLVFGEEAPSIGEAVLAALTRLLAEQDRIIQKEGLS